MARPGTVRLLLALYVALLPLGWPRLPLNMKLCDLAFVALAVATIDRGLLKWRFRPLDWAVMAYLAASAIAIRGGEGVAPGTVVLAKQLTLAAVYVVFARLAHTGLADFTARAVVATAAVFSAAALTAALLFAGFGFSVPLLGAAMQLPYIGRVFRLFGAADSPELFACFLAFAIPFVVAGLPLRGRAGSLTTMALASLGTFAHSIAGVLTATAAAWSADRSARAHRVVRMALVAAACAAIVVVNAVLAFAVRDVTFTQGRRPHEANAALVYEFQEPDGARTITVSASVNPMSYYLLKVIALEAFLEHPWRGTGLGSFHDLTEQAYQRGRIHEPYRRIDPHSTWFGRLAEAGALGASTLVALWVTAAGVEYRLRRHADTRAIGRALLGATAGLAVAAINVDVMNFRFLWIGFGLARGLQERVDERDAAAAR